MRLGVIEIGAAASELLVGDVDARGHTAVCAARQACGLGRGAGYGVVAATGALVSAAADAGAERIFAVVTSSAEHARAFADEAQRVFTIDVEPLDAGAAAALALQGRRGRSAAAVFLEEGALGLAGLGPARRIPIDLHGRRLARQLAGGRIDGELVACGSLTVDFAAAVAAVAELLGASSVAVEPEAIRAGALLREWQRGRSASYPNRPLM